VPTIDGDAVRIAAVFNRTFATSHRTVLLLGGDEPLYLPATASQCAVIVSNRDYAASALHEIAHWCLASAHRRTLVDYGYWYEPPPRDSATQARFLAAEERNQALECVLAAAARLPFRVSLDDVDAAPSLRCEFELRVAARARALVAGALPRRAARFHAALGEAFADG
jgi:elongation factor P hydroxylase